MTKIISITKFRLEPFGDGGSKRSLQLRELFAGQEFEVVDERIVLSKSFGILSLCKLTLRSVCFVFKHYPYKEIKSITHLWRLIKYYALRLPVIYDRYADDDIVFCWENTSDIDLVYLLKATGHRVIALPHNLETLVSTDSYDSVKKELGALGVCDSVFLISKEETWLLRLFGLNAFYLPYYPPKAAYGFLQGIRKQRESRPRNSKIQLLLLGSATNIPTRSGMQVLIDSIPDNGEYDVVVAGYGTESLSCNGDRVEFRGAVSSEDLENLLVETDAVLIYQPPTTGALTRITEMLIAGVPVFVDFNAGRSFHDVEDVYVYTSFDHLFFMLGEYNPHLAKAITREVYAETLLHDVLTKGS